MLLTALGGCSSSRGSGSPAANGSPSTPAAGDTVTTTAPVEVFDGKVEDFYRVPKPLPEGPRGTLIRTQVLTDAPAGQVGVRVMYHSEDRLGRDRAATGTIYYPKAKAPSGGWPVVAYAHGTTGIIAKCAPSRTPSMPPTYGVEGVVVAPDYIGLGPVGEMHSYLSATAEGNAMVDLVRVVRSIPDAHTGRKWVIIGHSQGGHGALVTMDRAGELPDMELLGTVSLAPGAEFLKTFGDEVQLRIISTMVLIGGQAEWPGIKPSDYLSPKALAASAVVREQCLDRIIPALLPIAASDDFYVKEPSDGPARKFLVENDPTPKPSQSPLLLMTGTADIIVVPARVRSLRDRLCRIGQVLDYGELDGVDHGGEPAAAAPTVTRWLADRFAGKPAPNWCKGDRTVPTTPTG